MIGDFPEPYDAAWVLTFIRFSDDRWLFFFLHTVILLQIVIKVEGGAMRGFHNSSFDPQTPVLLETAFDEAWLTLNRTATKL